MASIKKKSKRKSNTGLYLIVLAFFIFIVYYIYNTLNADIEIQKEIVMDTKKVSKENIDKYNKLINEYNKLQKECGILKNKCNQHDNQSNDLVKLQQFYKEFKRKIENKLKI